VAEGAQDADLVGREDEGGDASAASVMATLQTRRKSKASKLKRYP